MPMALVTNLLTFNTIQYEDDFFVFALLLVPLVSAPNLSGTNASCFTLQSDTPSANQCTITRKPDAEFSGSASLTLTAQISYNGTVVSTKTKTLTAMYISGDSNPCTTGMYQVEGLPSNYTVTWRM